MANTGELAPRTRELPTHGTGGCEPTDAAHSCSHGCANSSTYGCTDWHSDKYVDGSIRGPLQIHMS